MFMLLLKLSEGGGVKHGLLITEAHVIYVTNLLWAEEVGHISKCLRKNVCARRQKKDIWKLAEKSSYPI